MKNLTEVLKSSDIEFLLDQIKLRREMINTMIGWLYPTILKDEICEIQKHIDRLDSGIL